MWVYKGTFYAVREMSCATKQDIKMSEEKANGNMKMKYINRNV